MRDDIESVSVIPTSRSSLKKSTIAAMTIFSIFYLLSESNLDGFNIQEAVEFIQDAPIESIPAHITGFVASFISNTPLLAAIIYCWAISQLQGHDHKHSRLEQIVEYLAISIPFSLMGSAAYLDSMNEMMKDVELTTVEQVFAYLGAVLSGLITGFGAYKLHSFHAHESAMEHGGGLKGFFMGVFDTFVRNIWAAKNDQPTVIKKFLTVINEIWKKYGIVAVHGFLGNFAAEVFLEKTGIGNKYLGVDLLFKIFMPVFVMLYEGHTEARSLDEYKRKLKEEPMSYSMYSKLVVILAAVLHTLPAITSLSLLTSNLAKVNHKYGPLYNSLIFVAASISLGYPSIYGFYATTLKGFDEATKGIKKKVYSCIGWNPDHDEYQPIENKEEKASYCSTLLSKCCFWRRGDSFKEIPINYDDFVDIPIHDNEHAIYNA